MPHDDRDIGVAEPSPTVSEPGDGGHPAEPPAPAPEVEAPPLQKVGKSYLTWLMLASFGGSLALMVPLSYSLALRISDLAPGHEEQLGYITGSAQFIYLVLSPVIGLWSDRTRSRLGRRTPFMIVGALLGTVALAVVALAPTVLLVGLAWVLGMIGWSTAGQAIQNIQADRVPEEQRGRISALTSVMTQIAPVIGIGLAYAVASSTLLVFLVPGLLGAALVVLFPLFKPEGDSRELVHVHAVTPKDLVASYGFSPRAYPDFGWNWLGRFVFFMGLYFNTTFGTFFYAQRLDMPVKEVAGIVAAIGILGVVAATGGAIGGGFLSDKLGRRKLFTLIGSALFVTGAVTEAFAHSLPQLVIGAVLMQLAIAVFSAVDQAIVFAVLPDRAQAGRYLAVVAFAQKIPSAIAPLIAPLIITVGATGGEKNYTQLYLIGAVLALAGGLIVKFKVKSVR
ncbi:putative major facilitator superfamily (MFS) transporter [Streptomyces himastatinicus ATCC 53653]|uniref:Putative major facilitator superfamily (MFS) transporter n=1 Tax=Streptomyces himastatinicus ATCC 53653 TaxID=457427 RepID=D9WFU1_9ACTN|nr:MFS transporter [Streptomyces himastatinicus]EFL21177.1 putative major facilitator superfamily (MFS) transporter [Streptomyces himastatinicus ATCC 53653]